jgi:hypothetical protein
MTIKKKAYPVKIKILNNSGARSYRINDRYKSVKLVKGFNHIQVWALSGMLSNGKMMGDANSHMYMSAVLK